MMWEWGGVEAWRVSEGREWGSGWRRSEATGFQLV